MKFSGISFPPLHICILYACNGTCHEFNVGGGANTPNLLASFHLVARCLGMQSTPRWKTIELYVLREMKLYTTLIMFYFHHFWLVCAKLLQESTYLAILSTFILFFAAYLPDVSEVEALYFVQYRNTTYWPCYWWFVPVASIKGGMNWWLRKVEQTGRVPYFKAEGIMYGF